MLSRRSFFSGAGRHFEVFVLVTRIYAEGLLEGEKRSQQTGSNE